MFIKIKMFGKNSKDLAIIKNLLRWPNGLANSERYEQKDARASSDTVLILNFYIFFVPSHQFDIS